MSARINAEDRLHQVGNADHKNLGDYRQGQAQAQDPNDTTIPRKDTRLDVAPKVVRLDSKDSAAKGSYIDTELPVVQQQTETITEPVKKLQKQESYIATEPAVQREGALLATEPAVQEVGKQEAKMQIERRNSALVTQTDPINTNVNEKKMMRDKDSYIDTVPVLTRKNTRLDVPADVIMSRKNTMNINNNIETANLHHETVPDPDYGISAPLDDHPDYNKIGTQEDEADKHDLNLSAVKEEAPTKQQIIEEL